MFRYIETITTKVPNIKSLIHNPLKHDHFNVDVEYVPIYNIRVFHFSSGKKIFSTYFWRHFPSGCVKCSMG